MEQSGLSSPVNSRIKRTSVKNSRENSVQQLSVFNQAAMSCLKSRGNSPKMRISNKMNTRNERPIMTASADARPVGSKHVNTFLEVDGSPIT